MNKIIMYQASFKHPKKRKLLYAKYFTEKEIPKELREGKKTYFLYGVNPC
ncbi:MAG: hypothetical protein M0P71_18425 [Melioribacteraceae bacterium]|jgi:hypothetical protein|nr:hypothetical protein [Melioribacteraceae bacterium]